MTYATFHLYFTVPVFFLTLLLNWTNPWLREKRSWQAVFLLIALAMVYTTPWDNYLIRSAVWAYPEARVLYTVFQIPIEEYFFFIIQTLIGCLLAMKVLSQWTLASEPYTPTQWDRVFVVVFSVALILPILYALHFTGSQNPYRYLFLVAGWASPVVLLQWSLGYRILLRLKWPLLTTVIPLTIYLWIADHFAIKAGIWFFPEGQTTGLTIGSILPVEEALFFLMTNLMVVQGFILFTQFNRKELPVKLGGHPF